MNLGTFRKFCYVNIPFLQKYTHSFPHSRHVIQTKTTFGHFVESLGIHGMREGELYDALAGSSGSSSLKHFMYDDY